MKLLVLLCILWLQSSAVLSVLLKRSHQPLNVERLEQEAHHTAAAAVSYSNDWAVQVHGDLETVNRIASDNGFINMGPIGNLEGYFHFQLNVSLFSEQDLDRRNVTAVTSRSIGSLTKMSRSLDLSENLQQHRSVGFVEQQRLHKRSKKDYVVPTDPNWRRQWSLLNTGSITHGPAGKDLNVEPAWMQNITGAGVVVAIVDNGLERRHSDLSANYDSYASHDYVHYDSDPTPDNYYGDDPDTHGTECAGVIGMAKSNRHCGVGVAHNAHIGGLKFDLSSGSDLTEASMLGFRSSYIHVYSNSWGPTDYGFYVDGPGALAQRTLITGTTSGRNGKGSIYVWAAGNGGRYYDSCAADGYSSSIYTIAVGSADQTGGQADYDENCPGKMAVTFSYNSNTFPGVDDTWDPYNQVSTTTLSGRCTDDFTGTSASAPLLSGTLALVLQANPQLTWRDMQYLIVYTSNRDRLVGGDWVTNGGGLRVSPKFGFGAIDAEALVTRARRWINVPAQHTAEIRGPVVNTNVQPYTTRTITFDVTSTSASHISFLEHVVVTMSLQLRNYGTGYNYSDFTYQLIYGHGDIYDWLEASHPKRGDIQITLTSPQRTISKLLPYRRYDFINEEGYTNWPFMSVHHWGENPVGRWTLTVTYRSSRGYVIVGGVRMKLHGTTTTPRAVSSIPAHCDTACLGACSGGGPSNCDVCRYKRVAATLQCVTSCPSGTTPFKKYCLGTPTPITPPATPHPTTPPSTPPMTTPPTTQPSSKPSSPGNHFTHTTPSATPPSHTDHTHISSTHATPFSHMPPVSTPSYTDTPLSSSENNGAGLINGEGKSVTKSRPQSSFNTGAVVGSSVSGVLVLVGVATILTLVVVILVLRARKLRYRRLQFQFIPLNRDAENV